MPSPRGRCWPTPPSAHSTRGITCGTTTCRAPCCSRRYAAPPTGACKCGSCSTTITPPASTPSSPRSTRTRTSRFDCSIRSGSAAGACWAISRTSSASTIPAARVLPRATATSIAGVAADAARAEHHPDAAAYRDALARSSFVRDLLAHRLPFDWAGTRMLSDDPAKGLGRAPEDALLWHRLMEILRAPMRELRLVSPYFVPGSAGVEALAVIARQGVKVAVLTNALEATDVAVVHAGYAKRRKALLAAGITLFELKRGSSGARKRVGWTGRSGSGSSA